MTARVWMLFKSRASLTCFRDFFLPGRAKDLSTPRYKLVKFWQYTLRLLEQAMLLHSAYIFRRRKQLQQFRSIVSAHRRLVLKIFGLVDEWKTNLMSLAVLFHFLCTQHVSDINMSIIRSLRLCCWVTTSVVLILVRCVLRIWCGWVWVVSV